MSIGTKFASTLVLTALCSAAPALLSVARASAKEEGRLLLATEVLQQVQSMPDQRVPENLLKHAYGIAVIPGLTNIAFIFGGRHGNGTMVVRDTLNSPWSNPVCVSITGGSWGLQIGAQQTDLILVFTTRRGVEGVAGGKLTLGANASVAAGPVGRQGSASTDLSLAEIYSYARSRGLFGGIALDGSVLSIDRSGNASLYGQPGINASQILLGQSPVPPEAAHRFLVQVSESTHAPMNGAAVAVPAPPGAPGTAAAAAPSRPEAMAPAGTAPGPAAASPTPASPAPDGTRTYPLETPQ